MKALKTLGIGACTILGLPAVAFSFSSTSTEGFFAWMVVWMLCVIGGVHIFLYEKEQQ